MKIGQDFKAAAEHPAAGGRNIYTAKVECVEAGGVKIGQAGKSGARVGVSSASGGGAVVIYPEFRR